MLQAEVARTFCLTPRSLAAAEGGCTGSVASAASSAAGSGSGAGEVAATDSVEAAWRSSRQHATLGRVFGLTSKASLLSAHRLLDLIVLSYVTAQEEEGHWFLSSEHWWLMVFGIMASTGLTAVALSRHRSAIRLNKRFGWCWAGLAALSQLGPLMEMVDKLGDGIWWGVLDASSFASGVAVSPLLTIAAATPQVGVEFKGSRYGENLMRGLRKLCIASFPSVLLSTSVHGVRLLHEIVAPDAQLRCNTGCLLEVAAYGVGILCLAMACADLVLYVWVDDVFVRTHRKLVQMHYFLELIAREPVILFFHVALAPKHGWGPVILLWAADSSISVFLLLFPTLRTCFRRRLSARHTTSQAFTALVLSQLLFGVDVAFFDPRDAFIVVNTWFYLAKYVQIGVMMHFIHLESVNMRFFQHFLEAQLVATILSAAFVWVVVPWKHRALDERLAATSQAALPRLSRLLPNAEHHLPLPSVRRDRAHSMPIVPGSRGTRRASMFAFDASVARDRAMSLELGTVMEPPSRPCADASKAGADGSAQLACLGDILEALCMLTSVQSARNGPLISRALIADTLWSLVLPWEGEYDDGDGGAATITPLESERGLFFIARWLRSADAATGESQPPGRPADVEGIACVLHGTAIELVWPGEGRIHGHFNGQCIRFTDSRQSLWTKAGEQGNPEADAPLKVAPAAQELLSLVVRQLLLALRWEPSFLGLSPAGEAEPDGGSAAVDASQRPLIAFLVRYILATRDLVMLSEVYWSLWCFSRDALDPCRDSYEGARWVLLMALHGGVEFWDGSRGICLDTLCGQACGSMCSSSSSGGFNRQLFAMGAKDTAFRQSAIKLLARQGAIWRQCMVLARTAAAAHGGPAERTRTVRQKLAEWHFTAPGREAEGDAQDADDPHLAQLGAGHAWSLHVSLTDPLAVGEFVSMPVDPGVRFHGVDIQGCEILPSNAAPLLLSCWRDGPPSGQRPDGGRKGSRVASAREVDKYMVKVGDDLRQDQLVLQMLALMERVWKERLPRAEFEMLRLAPYRVLAMTPDAGYVKFVPGAVSLSKALHQSHGDLVGWLDTHRPRSLSLAQALSTLCGSVAAYCAATYVLGIGDRHLDNLQITPTGQFFHIDFGFIFGDDPKPFAPRLRLPQPVASALHDVLAGPDSAGPGTLLDRCVWLAGRAYVALRRSLPLWVSLLRVTGEAGGAGCQRLRTQADAAVVIVRERLRSDLPGSQGEEAAAAEFLACLCESTEALYPMLTDKVHQMGLFWK